MTGRLRVAALLAVVALLSGGAWLLASAWDADAAVPVYRVERGPFRHRVEAEGLLVAEQATVLSTPAGADGPMKVAYLADDGTRVEAGQVVIRFDPTEMEKELFDGQVDRDKAISKTRQKSIDQGTALANLDRDAAIADLQLQHARDFQTTDEEIFSRAEIIESQIDETLAATRKSHATEARGIRDELGQVEIDLLGLDQRQAQIAIDKAESGLRELELRAPHAGIFVLRRDWGEAPTIGMMAWAGMPLAEIPQLDAMKAQIYVLEADAGGVEEGVAARVRLEAHPGEVVEGAVRRVAAVAKRRHRWSPVQYFDVELQLARTDPETMKPGQRVRATLLIQDLDDVLAVPREAVFVDDEGISYVYRRTASGFERRDVGLGPAALGRVVIESGVEEGDLLALQEPGREPDAERDNGPAAPAVGTGGRR